MLHGGVVKWKIRQKCSTTATRKSKSGKYAKRWVKFGSFAQNYYSLKTWTKKKNKKNNVVARMKSCSCIYFSFGAHVLPLKVLCMPLLKTQAIYCRNPNESRRTSFPLCFLLNSCSTFVKPYQMQPHHRADVQLAVTSTSIVCGETPAHITSEKPLLFTNLRR